MNTRQFDVRTVLTVTTGRLLTRSNSRSNGIEDLYELLNWMTNGDVFTHQLPQFSKECQPWLLRWFPELEVCSTESSLNQLEELLKQNGDDTNEGIRIWISEFSSLTPTYDVPRIPMDDHDRKNPFDKLIEMRGTDEGIIIINPEEEDV